MSSLVERAKHLAHRAHDGQVDKSGRTYIEHVSRVASAVSDDPEAETVAWLHDVLEDCDSVFAAEIRHLFPLSIYCAIVVLTRRKGGSDKSYYEGVRLNPLPLRVKMADIDDNANEKRLALLDDKTATRLRRKYALARKMLDGGSR